ncbi:putative rRNA-processing protein EBP2 [Huso huso]|uniref:rRNA-processing protein EBP2 n=1 Tax=Huso huso TaxID=61971 RepID=A0ABR0ZHZ8_HUSHU
MEDFEEESVSGSESEGNDSVMSDGELQEAFAKGLLKPGLNIPLEARKKAVNNVVSILCVCVCVCWTAMPALDNVFYFFLSSYRQAQAAVLEALPRLKKFNISTKRPEDYFAEMAKTDHHMQKARIRTKLLAKQASMEKSEKAKQLRELRKYGKKVQTDVLQKRQKDKKAMMTAVKKYQKGMTDKLDFMDGDQEKGKKGASGAAGPNAAKKKRGPNAKRQYTWTSNSSDCRQEETRPLEIMLWNTKESPCRQDVQAISIQSGMHGTSGKDVKPEPLEIMLRVAGDLRHAGRSKPP